MTPEAPIATADRPFPVFPPGMWRRIIVAPGSDHVSAGLEDDVHYFLLRLRHRGLRVTAVETVLERFPWSTCASAGSHLAEALVGRELDEIAAIDPHDHCTHLIELAVVAAALSRQEGPQRFDLRVADRIDGLTTAQLSRNGIERLRWRLDGTTIVAPADWSERDLRRLSTWRADMPPDVALEATMLRRVVNILGARLQRGDLARPVDRGPGRVGACHTYQPAHVREAVHSQHDWLDFANRATRPPLADGLPGRWADTENAAS